MKYKVKDIIDFERVNVLLEGFNKATGFVAAILDLEGNVLSKSDWRQICTEFHRVNPETSKKCVESDTVLAGEMAAGEKYHFYKCLNGLTDVAVPIIINNEHVANLFSGQFFFEKPDREFFINQAKQYNFDNTEYLNALDKVPVVSEEKVKITMDFLLNLTQMISEMSLHKIEQVEFNEALKESEERLRRAEKIGKIGNWEYDLTTHVITWSNHVYAIFDRDPILGPPSDDEVGNYYTEEDHKRLRSYIQKIIETGEPVENYEYFVRSPNGNPVLCLGSMFPTKDNEGEIVKIFGFLQDISERKKAEELIVKNKNRLDYALTNINTGAWELDLIKKNSWRSLEHDKIFGYTKPLEEWTYDMFLEHVFPEDREMVDDKFQKAIATISDWNFECRINRIDGVIRWIFAMGKHELNKSKEPTKMFGVVQDISERKFAEIKLKISEEKFRSIIEQAGDAMYLSDFEGNIKMINRNSSKMLGYDQHELLTMKVGDLDLDYIDLELQQKLWNTLEVGQPQTIETNHKHKNGKIIPVEIRFGLFENDGIKNILGFSRDITDRKQAEEKLTVSENRFSRFSDNAKDMIYRMSIPDGVYEFINPACEEIFGYTQKEFYDNPKIIEKIIHPNWIAYFAEQWENLIKGIVPTTYEYEIVHKSGEKRWLNQRNVLIKNDKNEAIAIEGIVSDVTERIKVEKTLIENERQLTTLLANLPGMAYRCKNNSNWTMEFVSEGTKALTGYFPKELENNTGISFAEIIHPNDSQMVWDTIQKSVEIRESFNLIYRIKSKQGQVKWIREEGQVVCDEDDEVVALEGFITDITDRKQAEDNLKESEEKFRTLIDEMPAGVYLTDADGKCNYINPTWSQMSGLSLEEAKDNGWKMGIHQEDRDQVFSNWNKMIKSNGSWGFEYRMFDGVNSYWVDGRSKELKIDGKLRGYLGINSDITERKNNENILIDSKTRLEAIFNNTKDYQLLVEPETDNNFRMVAANKSYVDKVNQLGISIDETDLIGKSFKETLINVMFINEAVAADILINYVEVMQTKKQMEFIEDLKINDKDYYAEISLTPVLDAQGDCKYILYNSHDISEKKNAEKELENHRIHLEELVKERTKELEEKNVKLEKFNKLFVDREFRIKELKDKIKELEKSEFRAD